MIVIIFGCRFTTINPIFSLTHQGKQLSSYFFQLEQYLPGALKFDPIVSNIAAVSCGIVDGSAKLDLNYQEDSNAETDANFVMNENSEIIEIQCSAEKKPFSKEEFEQLFNLANEGIRK